jgi:hypothetical protein
MHMQTTVFSVGLPAEWRKQADAAWGALAAARTGDGPMDLGPLVAVFDVLRVKHGLSFLFDPARPGDGLGMEVITGDGSPLAYLQASMLTRVLLGIVDPAAQCEWAAHRIFEGEPRHVIMQRAGGGQDGKDAFARWTWEGRPPKTWDPNVRVENRRVRVMFHTLQTGEAEAVFRHVDTYTPHRYTSERKRYRSGVMTG